MSEHSTIKAGDSMISRRYMLKLSRIVMKVHAYALSTALKGSIIERKSKDTALKGLLFRKQQGKEKNYQ